MADDYLWDRTGPVDPEIAALEAVLAPLRMSEPLRAPVHPPLGPRVQPVRRRSPLGTIAVSVLTAAATAALIWAWVRSTTPEPTSEPAAITIDASIHDPGPVSVAGPPPVIGPPPALPSPPSAPSRGTAERPAKPTIPSVVASLPEVLSQTEVREALEAVKEGARACGSAHGALPGEQVVVKLSIAGATGLVTSSNALGKYRNTPLGNCVADAMARATFPRFTKESIGVQYPVTM